MRKPLADDAGRLLLDAVFLATERGGDGTAARGGGTRARRPRGRARAGADGPLARLPLPGRHAVTKPLARADDGDDQLVLGDLIDHLLNKGVVIQAEVVLSLAGVDLVYLRLQALLVGRRSRARTEVKR